jgi:hypothetical protein
MESAAVPVFVPLLWTVAAVALVVCAAILIRGSRGGDVSAIEKLLTPFAMPLGALAFIALMISGIGSLLLTVGKQTAVPVALALTVLIMILSYVASLGGSADNGASP